MFTVMVGFALWLVLVLILLGTVVFLVITTCAAPSMLTQAGTVNASINVLAQRVSLLHPILDFGPQLHQHSEGPTPGARRHV